MTNFERKRALSARWLPFVMLLLLVQGGCAVSKRMELQIDMQGSDPHAALLALQDTLLFLDFVEQEIPPDVPRRVDKVYRHAESWVVAVSIDAFGQEDRLVMFLSETTPSSRASSFAKDSIRQVQAAVQEIFGPENVQIVEIHRSLR